MQIFLSKYDAAKTLAAFSVTLHQEVDLTIELFIPRGIDFIVVAPGRRPPSH